jgi:hypothetical protein
MLILNRSTLLTTHFDNLEELLGVAPTAGTMKRFIGRARARGEHAGIRQERTVEHFQCTKCLYTWAESQ